MKPHNYIVHFVEPNFKVRVEALVGEVAVNKAVKILEERGIRPSSLKCKVNFWRVD
jgi:hypothetical protein